LITILPGEYSKLDYEIIVIDDNSPDGTIEIGKQLQKLYGEQHIVSGKNKIIAEANEIML